jgi:DNA-binding LytR/AlgR family response regulator
MNCIIIEDEPLALQRTQSFVKKVSYLNLVNSFDNGIDALDFLRENRIDLIFLDIQMDDLTGIQLLENLTVKPSVIITTAYDHYAIKSFELEVDDYLLKPFDFSRFLKACDRVYQSYKQQSNDTFIFIKHENRLEKVELSSIKYIEGMRDYRKLYLKDRNIMSLKTFKEFESDLPSNIVRTHKSYMVNIDFINSIERDRIYIDKSIIPISDTYKEKFFAKIIKL